MKCSGEYVILRGIFHVVSRFPLHFMLYRGNFDYVLDSVRGFYSLNTNLYLPEQIETKTGYDDDFRKIKITELSNQSIKLGLSAPSCCCSWQQLPFHSYRN